MFRRSSQLLVVSLALALVAVACVSDTDTEEGQVADGDESGLGSGDDVDGPVDQQAAEFDYSTVDYDAEPAGSALRGDRFAAGFPPAVVDPDEIRSGGPPPDGIPPLDDPTFLAVSEVDYLADDEAVILVELGDEARAYPVQILIWHEIVNDEIDGIPVSITYCPLCNSALAFDRRVGDRVLDFGTSGELYQSALVMYDRQTESLWAHFTGRGIVGHYAGAELDLFPAQTISWSEFRTLRPDGLVLSRETGHRRSYGENPYVGYDEETSGPISAFFDGDVDPTMLAKARIVGIDEVETGSSLPPVAVRLDDLAQRLVVAIEDDGRNLVAFYQEGLASALDTAGVADGRDVGQTGVFTAVAADGTPLDFEPIDGGKFRDDQTGSIWNVLGEAIEGPLDGERLAAVPHLNTFWFAWATYQPDTTIVEPS